MSNKQPLPGGTVPNEVGSATRLSRPSPSKAPDARIQQLIHQINKHGYAIIPNAFSPSIVAEAKAEVARLTADPEMVGPAGEKGRNTFEGYKTQRLYALANKSRVFDAFALHEDVLALNDEFLDPGYLINSFQSINILPGETTNGATVIVPDSHLWDSHRVPSAEETIPVIMPAGSMLFFLSTLWHGGGANTSDGSRLALTAQYCQPWIRPMENQILAVDWEKLDEIPESHTSIFSDELCAEISTDV
ncbi:hypothetical protein THAR02_09376 [Trichoderma harzianum]|uniref:Phytanoyl-CoA dioxygenase n=1 Tax=Trichoderma harzianum TaxID=5544 RepID=A0A0F9ZZ69_TRIHA|nr:hypothetical protein THAR02_09376 [Trichoderma harzianum]